MKKICSSYNKSKEDNFELFSALEKPKLVHYNLCIPKVWYKNSKVRLIKKPCKDTKKWYYYANKTKYYKEIYDKYMK